MKYSLFEEVPVNYIRGLHITPFPKGVRIEVDGDEDQYTVEVFEPVTGINPASLIRLRDDCISFDPLERAGILDSEDKAANMGIRMVTGIVKDVSYQNLLGQNVLTLKI